MHSFPSEVGTRKNNFLLAEEYYLQIKLRIRNDWLKDDAGGKRQNYLQILAAGNINLHFASWCSYLCKGDSIVQPFWRG